MNLPKDASSDQSNCPPDYYRRSNGMLHQLGNDIATIPGLTDDDLRKLAREGLSTLLQSIDAKTSPSLFLSVVRETMDRLEGKPTQRIEQKIEHTGKLASSELTNEQLIAALRKADAAGLLPGGSKLLEDGTVITDADYVEVKSANGESIG